MSEAGGPTVRRRRLGFELRRLREQAKLDQAAAAKHLECSTSKISRLEKGQGLARALEVRSLLDLYGVTDQDDRTTLLEIHRKAAETGWWEQAPYDAVLPSGLSVYVGLEYDARSVHNWELGYIPGLLQTEAYARTVLSDFPRQQDEVDRLVQVRVQRQLRITADKDPLELWAVVDETALRRPVGGPEVMNAQIKALIDAAQRPNVTLQVFPLGKGVHPGLRGSLTILEFDANDPPIGYVDSQGGNIFVEKDAQVRLLAHDFRRLVAGALDPAETAALLQDLAAKETEQ